MVGLVINEDGNSIAVIDPDAGQVIGSTDISAALSKPHLAAYDPATQRLFVGSKGSKLAVLTCPTPLLPSCSRASSRAGMARSIGSSLPMVWSGWPIRATAPSTPTSRTTSRRRSSSSVRSSASIPPTAWRYAQAPTNSGATNRPEDAPGFVLRIDARTRSVIGEPLQTTGQLGDRPNNTAFTPDGSRAYVVNTGSKATQITVVDPETFTVITQIEQDPVQGLSPHAIAFDPETQRMFVANMAGDTLSAIDVTTDTVVGYLPVGEEPHGVTLGPDGLVYVTVKHANKVAVVDPRTLTVVREITDPSLVGPHQILFVSDSAS